jgi:hypothetical protein
MDVGLHAFAGTARLPKVSRSPDSPEAHLDEAPHHGAQPCACGLRIVTREELDAYAGTWEALQEPALLDLYARHYGWRPMEHGGVRVAGRSFPGIGLLRAKVYSPEAAGADWHRVLSALPAGHVEVMTNEALPRGVASPLSPPDLYSFIVDLRPGADGVFASFKPNTRKVIRRAQREGMTVRGPCDPGELPAFHEVLLRVTRGGQVYEAPDLALLQAILRAGFGRLYLLEYRGRLVGGLVVLVNRHAQGYLLAFDREASDGLTSYLLFWGAMKGEIEAGMPFLDLGAQSLSMHPGLTNAKRSFCPVLLPAYRYELKPSCWRAPLDGTVQWFRRSGRAGA